MKKINLFFAAVFIVSAASFLYESHNVSAFTVAGAFLRDSQSFNVLFDADVASSTFSTSTLSLSTSTLQAVSTFPENTREIFGSVSGTLTTADTVTVSSTAHDTLGNANLASTTPFTFLPAIKIAAVRSGTTGNNLNEFIMLYNTMNQSWNASSALHLHVLNASGHDNVIPLTFATSTIPANGFFLIASANGYGGTISPDATYSSSTDILATSTTAIFINSTSTPTDASSIGSVIDKVEWGASAQIGSSVSFSFATTTASTSLPLDYTFVRKASSASTPVSMASGGSDSNKGNGYDTRDNAQDFVMLSGSLSPALKNSASPSEFASGGGVQDATVPIVMGSFPSGMNGEMVPTDLQFVGFGFNKSMDGSTITSSTVSLVQQGQATNMCSSVSYSNSFNTSGPPGQCTIPAGALIAGSTYVFTIKGSSSTPSVHDSSGNVLNQPSGQNGNANHDYQVIFTPTSGFTLTPQTPPSIIGSFPAPGANGIPTNISSISIGFSQAIDPASLSGVTLLRSGGSNVLNALTPKLSSDGKSATIPVSASPLLAGTTYTLTVPTTVRNSNNVNLPQTYTASFVTGASGGDMTGPLVLGHLPNIATGVPVNATDIHLSTDDALNPTTITSSTVQITDANGNHIPGTLTYDSLSQEIVFVADNVFQTNTLYTVTLNAASATPVIENVVGLPLQDSDGSSDNKYTFSFTTSASPDTTQPGLLVANANTFSLSLTFDEAVKQTEAENIANYALTSGGNPVTLSSFNGNTASYDLSTHTVTINNLALTAGASFSVTVSNVHDLSGNVIDPTKVSAGGTVLAPTLNGGIIGMGGGYIAPTNGLPTGFSSGSFGFVPQVGVHPMNTTAGFTSGYAVDLPISTQIPASGKIVLTFPSSFTLANAIADTFSPANNDINGPGTGTVTIASVVGDDTAHTVTVTLGGTGTQSNGGDTHDFLHFDLAQIVNPTVPNTADGYTIDIRTLNGSNSLESFTSMPFFITSAGSNSLTVNLTASGATNGTSTVYLLSPQTGPISRVSTAFVGASSTVIFSGLQSGMYALMTDPIITLTGGTFIGQSNPTPVNVNGSTSFALALSPAGSLASTTVSIHATGAKKVSVFAGGPNGYVDTPLTTSNGTTTVAIYYPANGDYTVGVGPQMSKTFNGPPPAPDYVMPQPVQVHVASNLASQTTLSFDLVSAGLTIAGSVKDGSGKAITGANVYAYSPQGGSGTFGTTASDGSFALNVAAGSYEVGARAPGFPSGIDTPVVVDSSGSLFVNGAAASSSSVTVKLSKGGVTISGKVTDGTNPVQGAQVWAYCDSSVSNNACFGPNSNVSAQTDSSGAFTLYVGNGTWKIGSFIPGYGQQPILTQVISGSNVTLSDIRPSATGTFATVSGTVCTNTTSDCTSGSPSAVSGAMIRIQGTDASGNFYSNSVISGSDGSYSFASSVPSGAGSSYRVLGNVAGLGEIAPTANFSVTGNVSNKDLVLKAGRTVNLNVSNPPSTYDMFLKFTNTTSGVANYLTLHNNASGTISLQNGSTYAIDARAQGFSFPVSLITLTGGTATYSTSTGQLALNGGSSDTVTLNLAFPAANVVSGTVKDGSGTLLSNAWVDFADPTHGSHFGTQSNASGTYSLPIQDGSYQVSVYAPGYLPNPTSLSLDGGTITLGNATTSASTVNLIANKSNLLIAGTITIDGSPAANALVKGTLLGGSTSIVTANTDGTYSLPVSNGSWTVTASANGYQNKDYASTVTVNGSSVSGVDINLTSLATLGNPSTLSIVPSQGGTLQNASGTLTIAVPANALSTSANAGKLAATETSNVINTASAKVFGNGVDISAQDSSNNPLSSGFTDNVVITMDIASSSFAADALTSTSTASKMELGYFKSSLNDWVPVETTLTYEDANGAPVTAASDLSNVDHISLSVPTKHFTVFGIITPTDALAPSAPTNVSATQSGSSAVVTWTAPTTNSDGTALSDLQEYEIYRDTSASGSFTTQVNSSQVTGTTFTDSTVSAGTTYYYKVSAADTSGNESSKSSVSSGLAVAALVSGGGSYSSAASSAANPVVTTTNTETSTVENATPTSSPVSASVSTVTTPTSTTAPQAVSSTAHAAATLTRSLSLGSKDSEVTTLQKLLASDPSLYPEGLISGYFGALTKKAVIRFQEKYGIATDAATAGLVGPETRAKLMEVLGR
ncbi:MAG: carboxypeptidase regulatory-like domain-containing protein [Patescibacteria group bacterium]|nr:carboxypeptidase regulatory-like domain-containing protein [Patescibacteria group bacterium]MDE2437923.1 carboxypeptidase regulatory-like domain-containing protein [Patescibacteria group bacterium]